MRRYCAKETYYLKESSKRLDVSCVECSVFDRALLQKRPIILRSLLIEATPYLYVLYTTHICAHMQNAHVCMYIYVYIHIHMCMCTYICMYANMYICIMSIHTNSRLHLECHSITFSNPNLIGLFSTERGKRDHQNQIINKVLRLTFQIQQAIHVKRNYYTHGCEDLQNPLSCRSFSAKEPLSMGLFCGKRPTKLRHPMGFCRHVVPVCYVQQICIVRKCLIIYLHIVKRDVLICKQTYTRDFCCGVATLYAYTCINRTHVRSEENIHTYKCIG